MKSTATWITLFYRTISKSDYLARKAACYVDDANGCRQFLESD